MMTPAEKIRHILTSVIENPVTKARGEDLDDMLYPIVDWSVDMSQLGPSDNAPAVIAMDAMPSILILSNLLSEQINQIKACGFGREDEEEGAHHGLLLGGADGGDEEAEAQGAHEEEGGGAEEEHQAPPDGDVEPEGGDQGDGGNVDVADDDEGDDNDDHGAGNDDDHGSDDGDGRGRHDDRSGRGGRGRH